MLLTGKTAVITGGSRGIGRAIAVALAREGANVAVIYAGNTAAAEETVRLIEAAGARAVALQCDVAQEEAVAAMVKAVMEAFGTIDILVTGMTCQKCVEHVTEALKSLETVKRVSVLLRSNEPSQVTVLTDYEIEDDTIRDCIKNAGYEVVTIERDDD